MIYSNLWSPFSLLFHHTSIISNLFTLFFPFFLLKFLLSIPSVFSLTVWIRITMTSYDHHMNQWLHLTPLLSFQSHTVESSPFYSSRSSYLPLSFSFLSTFPSFSLPSHPSLYLPILLSTALQIRKLPTSISFLL